MLSPPIPLCLLLAAQPFVDVNVTGTLNLLEGALAFGLRAHFFTSTTSPFGDSLSPPPPPPAAWITEDVVPVPKNIYAVTEVAAEDLCQLLQRNHGLLALLLRTSRFFGASRPALKPCSTIAPGACLGTSTASMRTIGRDVSLAVARGMTSRRRSLT